MADLEWTPAMVEERFAEAADVMKRLPKVRVPGYASTWPKVLHEFADMVGQEPKRMRRPPPSPAAISRMEQALEWLRWLEAVDSKIVWLRASGERWKAICGRVGLGRAAANEHWQYALCVVAWRLSGRLVGVTMSRRRMIERTRAALPSSSALAVSHTTSAD
jgi:hypothetical protein